MQDLYEAGGVWDGKRARLGHLCGAAPRASVQAKLKVVSFQIIAWIWDKLHRQAMMYFIRCLARKLPSGVGD